MVLLVAAVAALVFGLAGPTPWSAPVTPSRRVANSQQPERQTAPSVPFDVAIEVTDSAPMDNDRLFGHQEPTIPSGAVEAASDEIAAVLDRYLDAEFVTAATRFSDRPLSDLLTQRAQDSLSAADLTGLGVLGLSAQQVTAEPVTATARALTSGSDVALMVVRYHAHAQVVAGDGASTPLHQRATMVFVPEDGRWRAEAVDAELDLPRSDRDVAS